jgi:hypothetical protein
MFRLDLYWRRGRARVAFLILLHDHHCAREAPWAAETFASRYRRAEDLAVGRVSSPAVNRTLPLGETWVLASDHTQHVGGVHCSTAACVAAVVDTATGVVRTPTDREFVRLMALELR